MFRRSFRFYFLQAAAVTLLLTATLQQATAQPPIGQPVQIRFLGMQEQQPLFQVTFSNPEGTPVVFLFRDEEGHLLHTEKWNAKEISRKFRFSEETGNAVELEVRRGKERQTFMLRRDLRTTEDLLVTRL
jgi:hypothetical protein